MARGVEIKIGLLSTNDRFEFLMHIYGRDCL